jgi:hypothetical protein
MHAIVIARSSRSEFINGPEWHPILDTSVHVFGGENGKWRVMAVSGRLGIRITLSVLLLLQLHGAHRLENCPTWEPDRTRTFNSAVGSCLANTSKAVSCPIRQAR